MNINGHISFSGDKSISHRALMLGALADGKSTIRNLSTGVDVQSTISCLQQCGIKIVSEGDLTIVYGNTWCNPTKPLDCGNSGTTVRLLTGLLIGKGISATLIGDESLSNRPMNRIIQPLKLMGANIKCNNSKLPIIINSSSLNGIRYELPIASAQVKSAILLAGLGAKGKTKIIEKTPTRDHTERMLDSLGVSIRTCQNEITISKLSKPITPFDWTIPDDPSTASFFISATLLLDNSQLTIENLLLNPTRSGFISIAKKMGADIKILNKEINFNETVVKLRIRSSKLKSVTISSQEIPSMIDEIPILAVLATQAVGKTEIRGAGELRVKESDRINAICYNLKNMGANVREFEDGFVVEGPTKLTGTKIKTFGDHRIAMAFSIASLISDGKNEFDNLRCIDISCPEFFELLNDLEFCNNGVME
ncbi:MAG: 3-phosphoshikimate 1-carboxyvinyltransferase [Candidatus Marinimicrobia bacterium]|nr:3-phosphoshikimate 1-carboxyvinyltransferase [Candidatus Neomarinimicrobiota bacterium]MBL7022891.1 3-phosphoshikimate 1-carboxyvinyltransferase [Candidatus Neomarinimicrobiota bacterium]MBL7109210.1 3-phosphoshikimate 1-carboxyvinyltransferase [Candidatus Neomarinimicrobiota bacterium]